MEPSSNARTEACRGPLPIGLALNYKVIFLLPSRIVIRPF